MSRDRDEPGIRGAQAAALRAAQGRGPDERRHDSEEAGSGESLGQLLARELRDQMRRAWGAEAGRLEGADDPRAYFVLRRATEEFLDRRDALADLPRAWRRLAACGNEDIARLARGLGALALAQVAVEIPPAGRIAWLGRFGRSAAGAAAERVGAGLRNRIDAELAETWRGAAEWIAKVRPRGADGAELLGERLLRERAGMLPPCACERIENHGCTGLRRLVTGWTDGLIPETAAAESDTNLEPARAARLAELTDVCIERVLDELR